MLGVSEFPLGGLRLLLSLLWPGRYLPTSVPGELPPGSRTESADSHFPEDLEMICVQLGPAVHGDEAELWFLGAPASATEGTDHQMRGSEERGREIGKDGWVDQA